MRNYVHCNIHRSQIMRQWLNNRIQRLWAERTVLSYGLMPFSYVFSGVASLRRFAYSHLYPRQTFPVPVIVVGNITVGGTGKTPFVIWLSKALKREGYHPGIVTRGYKGQLTSRHPVFITSNSSAKLVGDEALVLAQQSECFVVAGRDRCKAVCTLLSHDPKINVIISDDGLQHYAMRRQIEIVMMDSIQRWGNGFCLPAGPLRESPRRLRKVDMVISNHGEAKEANWQMTTTLSPYVYRVNHPHEKCLLSSFKNEIIHAVAGIGSPARFFNQLEAEDLNIVRHAFPDHYEYQEKDFDKMNKGIILMTQKDAVKCHQIAPDSAWYVELKATVSPMCLEEIIRKLEHGQKVT